MNHIKYSLVALLGWGLWAIGTKLISRNLNVVSITFWISFWSFGFLSVFLIFRKNLMFNNYTFYALPVGLVSLIAILAFYQALKTGPATVVLPLTNLYVILPVLFGFIVLKEAITAQRIIGVILAIVATILLSL